MVDEFEDSNLPFDLTLPRPYLGDHMFALHLPLVYYLDCHPDSS